MIAKAPFKSNCLVLLHSVVTLEIQGTRLVCLSGGFVGLTCTVPPGFSPCREDVFPTRLGAGSNCSDLTMEFSRSQCPTGAAVLGDAAGYCACLHCISMPGAGG